MKAGRIAALALTAALMIPTTVFAGTWTRGKVRKEEWKYIKDNGSYASGWLLIDGDKDGTYGYEYGGDVLRLCWDPVNRCLMTVTEERYVVYDLVENP